jgi:hypothetical protein
VRPPQPLRRSRGFSTASARPFERVTTAGARRTYVAWIRRYLFFHGKRHPADMGAAEITQFLSALAVQDHVAASTQNQALSARSGPSVFPSSSAVASERFSVSFTERRTCR